MNGDNRFDKTSEVDMLTVCQFTIPGVNFTS